MIAIIDYGMGNTFSVFNALDYIGVEAVITNKETEIKNADRIILPGVGAFGDCIENLKQLGLKDLLMEEVVEKGKPFMGICLGMQVLADYGTEKGIFEGLGWIKGNVQRFLVEDQSLKIPHVGWNDINIEKETPLFKGLIKERAFYFVHSYHFEAQNKEEVLATCDYGGNFNAALIKDNIFATQFHPEKSQKNGLIVLENFVKWRV
ncbi:MAG: imidazole glycerol phosphate synthase subunit HisH [Clostridia bacterium]|nr:imidazole glycerol phosphate synthase subunit HisH [Clostridia bacterium]